MALGEVPGALFTIVFPLVFFAIPFFGRDDVTLGLVLVLLLPSPMALFGIGALLGLPARWSAVRGPAVLATVDADGIAMHRTPRLRWGDVAEVRTVRAFVAVAEDSAPVMRLEIVPASMAWLAGRPAADRAYDAFRAVLRRIWPFGDRRPRRPAFGLDLDLVGDPAGLLAAIEARRASREPASE